MVGEVIGAEAEAAKDLGDGVRLAIRQVDYLRIHFLTASAQADVSNNLSETSSDGHEGFILFELDEAGRAFGESGWCGGGVKGDDRRDCLCLLGFNLNNARDAA